MCSPTAGACVRGPSPPQQPGPRLPLGPSFPLVSGGATLERLFLLPGARRGRGGAGAGRLGRGRRRGRVLLSALPASLPHPTPCHPVRPPAGLFGGPREARAGTALFRFSRGGRARAGGAGAGLGARGPRWSPAPRARRPARSAWGAGHRIAGGGHGRGPQSRWAVAGCGTARARCYCYPSPLPG